MGHAQAALLRAQCCSLGSRVPCAVPQAQPCPRESKLELGCPSGRAPSGKDLVCVPAPGQLGGWCEALGVVEWLAMNRPPTLYDELRKLWGGLTVGGLGEAGLDDASG